MKNMRELSEERNKILQTISKEIDDSIVNENKNKINVISLIISILALIVSILVPFWIYKMQLFNETLVLSSEIGLEIDDQYKDKYAIEFDVKQGGIKKAYIATVLPDDSIIYDSILQYSNGNTIRLVRDSRKSEEKIQKSTESMQFYNENEILGDGILEINTIEDFALVLLDTTEQWWIYYFVSTPEFIPVNCEYSAKIFGENGDEIATFKKKLEIQEMDRIFIDGSLTSVTSIEEAMKNLKVDYYLFEKPQSIKGKNGEIFMSNPRIENLYKLPKEDDIYNSIIKIRDDIKKLSL